MAGGRVKFGLTLPNRGVVIGATTVAEMLQLAADAESQPSVCHKDERAAPAYAPADLLKLYIYGYLNRVRSSRRLEAETHRNIEVIGYRPQLRD
jgi:transposase